MTNFAPQNPALPDRDPTNVMGRRIVAYIIDALILGIINGIIFFLMADKVDAYSTSAMKATFNLGTDKYEIVGGPAGLYYLITLALGLAVFVFMQGSSGASPGKQIMGLRVVDEAGQICGVAKAFIRWILLIVAVIPCCFPLVGLITSLTSKGHRRVGDMAAKTYVIDKDDVGTPPLQANVIPGGGQPFNPPSA